jgi:hypothetical protein
VYINPEALKSGAHRGCQFIRIGVSRSEEVQIFITKEESKRGVGKYVKLLNP